MIRLLSPRQLSAPAKISTRVAAGLFGLMASCGLAHAGGLMPTAATVSDARTSACQSEALHVGFQVNGQARVTAAVVSGVTAPCFAKAYRLVVQGSSDAPLYTATGTTESTRSMVVPIGSVAASEITAITVTVSS